MGAADAAGDADAGEELLDAVAVDDVDDVDDLDAVGDFDAAEDAGGLDKAGVLRAAKLCALAKVKGASANTAMAIYETVDFMTSLSLFKLRRGSSGNHFTLSDRPHRSQCASIRV